MKTREQYNLRKRDNKNYNEENTTKKSTQVTQPTKTQPRTQQQTRAQQTTIYSPSPVRRTRRSSQPAPSPVIQTKAIKKVKPKAQKQNPKTKTSPQSSAKIDSFHLVSKSNRMEQEVEHLTQEEKQEDNEQIPIQEGTQGSPKQNGEIEQQKESVPEKDFSLDVRAESFHNQNKSNSTEAAQHCNQEQQELQIQQIYEQEPILVPQQPEYQQVLTAVEDDQQCQSLPQNPSPVPLSQTRKGRRKHNNDSMSVSQVIQKQVKILKEDSGSEEQTRKKNQESNNKKKKESKRVKIEAPNLSETEQSDQEVRLGTMTRRQRRLLEQKSNPQETNECDDIFDCNQAQKEEKEQNQEKQHKSKQAKIPLYKLSEQQLKLQLKNYTPRKKNQSKLDYLYFWPIGVDVVELVQRERTVPNFEGLLQSDIMKHTKDPIIYQMGQSCAKNNYNICWFNRDEPEAIRFHIMGIVESEEAINTNPPELFFLMSWKEREPGVKTQDNFVREISLMMNCPHLYMDYMERWSIVMIK